MAKQVRRRQWVRGAVGWLLDQAVEHWPALISVAGGGLMTYLASISEWLAPYGPVAWGAVGLLTILLLALGYLLYGMARARTAVAYYTTARASSSAINVLAPSHERERIDLADFFHPFYRPTEHVRFEGCELYGPAVILLDGCNLDGPEMHDCEVVICAPNAKIMGGTHFRNCSFIRCRFYRVTLLMSPALHRSFVRQGASLPVISYGPPSVSHSAAPPPPPAGEGDHGT